jgi:hypothetical protein
MQYIFMLVVFICEVYFMQQDNKDKVFTLFRDNYLNHLPGSTAYKFTMAFKGKDEAEKKLNHAKAQLVSYARKYNYDISSIIQE